MAQQTSEKKIEPVAHIWMEAQALIGFKFVFSPGWKYSIFVGWVRSCFVASYGIISLTFVAGFRVLSRPACSEYQSYFPTGLVQNCFCPWTKIKKCLLKLFFLLKIQNNILQTLQLRSSLQQSAIDQAMYNSQLSSRLCKWYTIAMVFLFHYRTSCKSSTWFGRLLADVSSDSRT